MLQDDLKIHLDKLFKCQSAKSKTKLVYLNQQCNATKQVEKNLMFISWVLLLYKN